ncbi:MAG: hypothetical protein FWD71_17355, partial [Oscillospiraceae bacterium]|nr:hypothetical protein [Oscillospiraceae bacterium]
MNKKIKVILSVLIAVVLITAGTFAWVNFSQNVVNEFAGDGSHPGGTTHDDFDHDGDGHGHHQKDVYIENWGKTPIFVRIRLDEYMEIGKGAGLKGEQNNGIWIPNPDNLAESLISTANIDDKTTWEPHIPDGQADICDTPADFHKYWQWGMGGSKYYMPVSETDRADPAYVDQNITEYDGSEPGV